MEDKNKPTLKYPLLGDKEWLTNQYVENELNTSDISKIVGCSKDGVRVALKRHGIELRSSVSSNAIKFKKRGFKSKYEKLNNKEWLLEQYKNHSLEDIANLIGAKNQNSVRQALLFYGVDLRNRSEGLTFNRKSDFFIFNESVITGGLLGDAGLKCWNKSSNDSYPVFYRKNKFYDHVLWVSSLLFQKEFEDRIKFEENNGSDCYSIRSLTHKKLIPFWKKWYPESNNFIKIIPEDIPLDPIVLLHWFLDDGSTSFRKRKYKNGWTQKKEQVKLVFCSESFTLDDQEMLCDRLNSLYKLGFSISPCNSGTGYRIKIPQSSVGVFFDLIGPCPSEIPSMKYKWKITNE